MFYEENFEKKKILAKVILSMLIYRIKHYMSQLRVGCRIFNQSLVYEEKIETFIRDLIFRGWRNLSFCKTRNKEKGLNISLF
jgi:hypothetical protein